MPTLTEATALSLPAAIQSVPPVWTSVVAHLDPKYGGLSAAVPALASAVSDTHRVTTALAAFCNPGEEFQPAVASQVSVAYLPLSHRRWLGSATARRNFAAIVNRSSGLHIHGLWQLSMLAGARNARRFSKPYVVSAHGMLESWALSNKGLKKNMYAALFERANLERAACLHALTEAEAQDYRRFGLSNPIAVVPNGVTVPDEADSELFLNEFPQLRNKKLLLFLGRIHFKKGLNLLSEAWGRLAMQWPNVHLVLAGPDSENTRVQVEEKLRNYGVLERTTFTGMLSGAKKWSALKAAGCFILPSYSEGLSVSVLEAMGVGLPVIVTKQCNLPEVSRLQCGWVIEPKVEELVGALQSALSCHDGVRRSIGENGRRLVGHKYSWPVIGRQMASLYAWLAGGERPDGFPLYDKERL
jgi:glycosyltransferase involved in cell wall biosynthesis